MVVFWVVGVEKETICLDMHTTVNEPIIMSEHFAHALFHIYLNRSSLGRLRQDTNSDIDAAGNLQLLTGRLGKCPTVFPIFRTLHSRPFIP